MSRSDAQVYDLNTGAVWGGVPGTQGTALTATGPSTPIRGGRYLFSADGTAGGATISLQVQLLDNTWCDVGALAGNAIVKNTTLPFVVTPIEMPACNVRCAITGGAGSSVNAALAGVG